MLRNKFRQVCLYALFLIGVITAFPFLGHAVRTSIGPNTERRVETRIRDEGQVRTFRAEVSRGAVPSEAALTTATFTPMATSELISYRPFYGNGHYPYGKGHYCNSRRGCRLGKPEHPRFRGNPSQYQNYYMYHNYYMG